MSFISILEKEELNNLMKRKNQNAPKNWKEEREKAVQDIPYVIDINPSKSRRKDQEQWEMYENSYDSFLNR